MAYRIRNFDNLSVHQVNEIFRRGRGLGRSEPSTAGFEDFAAMALKHDAHNPHNPTPPAEVIDEELESVQ